MSNWFSVPSITLLLALVFTSVSIPSSALASDGTDSDVALTQRATTLHIAPDGDDRWSGRLPRPDSGHADGPLASLVGARDRIRALRREPEAPSGPITVLIADGTYRLTHPVEFEPVDGGSAVAPVVYQAAPGAHPIFDGGRSIMGFRSAGPDLWTAAVPGALAGQQPFEQLFVNGRRATRARSPNSFYYYMSKRVIRAADPSSGRLVPMENRGFVGRREDLELLAQLSAQQLGDVNLVAYHMWEISRHRIAAFDSQTGTVILTGPAPWPFFEAGLNQRYHIENLRNALDAPGEWFLDRDATVLYKPLQGEDPARARATVPVADAFVTIKGRPESGQWVEHLRLQGLTFRHSRYLLPREGHADGQAGASLPAVIMADGARHVVLSGCRVEHTGLYGAWFRRGCTDCRIERCAFQDLGAGGVRIGEHGVPADRSSQTRRITVHNNIIHGGGRIFPGAVGIWIGQSSDNTITHNDIADLFYTGVSVGWSWGYADTQCAQNIIEYNHIHHVGRGVLSDLGGVYTLGISTGTSVSNNVIHDVDSYDRYGRGGWGLYNDEGSTGIRLENNLVYNTATGGYHQHYGRENLVRNNIFALARDGQVQRSRAEPHISFTFEHNIIYWKDGPLLAGTWSDRNFRMDHNLYFNARGQTVAFAGQNLPEWRAATGQDQHSQIADPLFVNPDRFDFRLKPESPARSLGFKPFDFAQAGVNGDPAWVDEAAEPMPPAQRAPERPLLAVREDFESPVVGNGNDEELPYVPLGAKASIEGKPRLIALTRQTAASGRQSLKLTDATDLIHAYDPHFYFEPRYRVGEVVCRFALRLEPGAVFSHEWRDEASPYHVGPNLWIERGKLHAAGKELLDLPTGEWMRFEVRARLSPTTRETWSLTVASPGRPPRKATGLPCAPGWSSLDWIGFVSHTTRRSEIYLDDLELTCE